MLGGINNHRARPLIHRNLFKNSICSVVCFFLCLTYIAKGVGAMNMSLMKTQGHDKTELAQHENYI